MLRKPPLLVVCALCLIAAVAAPVLTVDAPVAGIEVDLSRGEVRIACEFVNPTRVLEVFACHESGPTHETVVSFAASGPQIESALREIGCRPASYWNATSPRDFVKNQGDRVLVSVRWRQAGRQREASAEGMLLDVHEGDLGLPAYVRGFSFAGGPVAPVAEGEARSGVPEAVEVTLGATKRESPSHPILTHPTNSTRLSMWALPPSVDPQVLPNLRELVESGTRATLVFRRVASELEFVEQARRRARERQWAGRLKLLEAIEPLARDIDSLKRDYEALIVELSAVLEAERPTDAAAARRGERAVVAALRRGQWLCARIEERYLSIYALQEAHKRSWLEQHGQDLSFDARDEAGVYARYGAPVELELVRKEVALAALRHAAGSEVGKVNDFAEKTIHEEMAGIERARDVGLAQASLRYSRHRLAHVENEYQREIFGGDVLKAEAGLELARAKQAEQATRTEEFRRRRDGVWDRSASDVLARRAAAVQRRELAELGLERVRLLERVRWSRHDAQDEDAVRRARAERDLEKLQKQLTELDARRARLQAQPPRVP